MVTSHSIRLETDPLSITGVDAFLPIFGRWAVVSTSVYTRARYGDHATLINIAVRPVSNRMAKVVMRNGVLHFTREDEFQDTGEASRDGFIAFYDGSGGHKRIVEQEIVIPHLHANILEFSYLVDGGEDAGRTIANAVLRKMESIVEEIRQSILSNLSGTFRDRVATTLAERYDVPTARALDSFLASINWKMLLMRSRCDDRCRDVVDYTLRHNPFTHYGIGYSDVVRVEPFDALGNHFHNVECERRIAEAMQAAQAEEDRENALIRAEGMAAQNKANCVAVDLMHDVLGKKYAKQFVDEGRITIENHGYSFSIAPNRWVDCVDPQGGRCELCIHTVGMSCNPIDEMILAVLNIKHHFAEYMYKAIVHCSRGFSKPKRQRRQAS